MKIHSINTGFFKLDGGAMFGVVPKSMWQKLNPPDENNMCTWAMRCLLIEKEDKKILIDTGLGDKQDAKFRSHFYPHGDDSLLGSLEKLGLKPEDITDVILTHLHFDHVGGAVRRDSGGDLIPTFPNAVYWSNKEHWDWAMNPNPREKASFLKENFVPLKDWGVLQFIDFNEEGKGELFGLQLKLLYGHTSAMMLIVIEDEKRTLAYCADLIPSIHHLGLAYVMGYDLRPLKTMEERKLFLEEALEKDWYLFFEHDPVNEICQLVKTEKGRITFKNPSLL